MTHEQWRAESVARIGRAVQIARREAGLSQEELASRIGSTRNAIQNMEAPRGRKSTFDVLDLIEISRAVGVPPVRLLYPELPDGRVAVSRGQEVRSIDALMWFSGEIVLDIPGNEVETVTVQTQRGEDAATRTITALEDGRRLVKLARERAVSEVLVRKLSRTAAVRRRQGETDLLASLTERIELAVTRIAAINAELLAIDHSVVDEDDGR